MSRDLPTELQRTLVLELRHESDKIKGSRFIATAAPIQSEADVEELRARLKSEFPAANHHCWAYRLGPTQDRFRYSDDGEPSGTGGRPILQQIDGRELTDVVVFVSRIFGGTKLGAGGLVRAYGGAARLVLDRAEIREIRQLRRVVMTFDYDLSGTVQSLLTSGGITPSDASYGESVTLTLEIPEEQADALLEQLQERTAGRISIAQERTRS